MDTKDFEYLVEIARQESLPRRRPGFIFLSLH